MDGPLQSMVMVFFLLAWLVLLLLYNQISEQVAF